MKLTRIQSALDRAESIHMSAPSHPLESLIRRKHVSPPTPPSPPLGWLIAYRPLPPLPIRLKQSAAIISMDCIDLPPHFTPLVKEVEPSG